MESQSILDWVSQNVNQYWVIMMLMAVESSFIPFPSEVVMIPAAYLCIANSGAFFPLVEGQPQSDLNIFLIVAVGTIGAILGAWINYGLSIWLGRPIIYKFANSRFGHMCLINQEKVEKAENYFVEHGTVGTLFGRLVPVVRQLISIPAGLARMNFAKFTIYTGLGALIWNSILAFIGYVIATQVDYNGLNAKIAEYNEPLKWAMIGLGVLIVAYLAWQGMRSNKKEA